jgi:predicted DNA-binding protein YlxM (UPF0122 family)
MGPKSVREIAKSMNVSRPAVGYSVPAGREYFEGLEDVIEKYADRKPRSNR